MQTIFEVHLGHARVDVEEEHAARRADLLEAVLYAACHDVVSNAAKRLQTHHTVDAHLAELYHLARDEPAFAKLVDEVEHLRRIFGHREDVAVGAIELEAALDFIPFMRTTIDIHLDKFGGYALLEIAVFDIVFAVDRIVDERLQQETKERRHNHLNTTEAGPFALLSLLEPGTRMFVINPYNESTPFTIIGNELISADDISTLEAIANQFDNTLTLVTCENELPLGGYANRRVVTAVPNE